MSRTYWFVIHPFRYLQLLNVLIFLVNLLRWPYSILNCCSFFIFRPRSNFMKFFISEQYFLFMGKTLIFHCTAIVFLCWITAICGLAWFLFWLLFTFNFCTTINFPMFEFVCFQLHLFPMDVAFCCISLLLWHWQCIVMIV